jgi:dolichol-phosphate mannosyltransferase
MGLSADGFGIETEMAVECVKNGIETIEVPITYLARPEGSETNLNPVVHGALIGVTIYKLAKTNNPLFYFGSVGVISLLAGSLVAAYVGYDWFFRDIGHEGLAVVASAGILLGVQLLMFGALSDMIVSLHREQLRRIEQARSLPLTGEPEPATRSSSDDPDPDRATDPTGEDSEPQSATPSSGDEVESERESDTARSPDSPLD